MKNCPALKRKPTIHVRNMSGMTIKYAGDAVVKSYLLLQLRSGKGVKYKTEAMYSYTEVETKNELDLISCCLDPKGAAMVGRGK